MAFLLALVAGALAQPQDNDREIIRRLGSESIEEREAAMKQLIERGAAVRPLLEEAARGGGEIAARAKRILGLDILEPLLKQYRAYELPFPPADAALVRLVDDGRSYLGFVLMRDEQGAPSEVLIGTSVASGHRLLPGFREVKVGPEIARGLDPQWWHGRYHFNAGLAVAMQLAARRSYDAALAVLERSRVAYACPPLCLFCLRADAGSGATLHHLACAHYAGELARPGTDRSKILAQMKVAVEAEPSLDNERTRWVLSCLEAAVAPAKPAPAGSIEAAITALMDATNDVDRERPDPRVLDVAMRGFEAIPALIEHLDDPRSTRSVFIGHKGIPGPQNVGWLASDMLVELAGVDLPRDHRLGRPVTKADALTWWETARKGGEEGYFTAVAIPTGPVPADGQARFPRDLVVRLLAKRYPDRLAEVYRRITEDAPHIESWHVAELLAGSALPEKRQVELFLRVIYHKQRNHSRAAVEELLRVDPAAFANDLLPRIEKMPGTPPGLYETCEEAALAHLAAQAGDPRVWAALRAATKRADAGLRCEIFDRMRDPYLFDRQWKRRIEFLCEWLDDATVRDAETDPAKYKGRYVGWKWPKLEVRNVAAMVLGDLCRVKGEPKAAWTDDQWADLRARVKQAIAK